MKFITVKIFGKFGPEFASWALEEYPFIWREVIANPTTSTITFYGGVA